MTFFRILENPVWVQPRYLEPQAFEDSYVCLKALEFAVKGHWGWRWQMTIDLH